MPLALADVHAARDVVYRTLKPTPLMAHPLLKVKTGLDIFVKHENHNPTGAFKVRGGLNLIANLSADERRGVITASTGNHGQSIALACQREGVPCTIVVPLGNNPDKNAAMRALGATARGAWKGLRRGARARGSPCRTRTACATCTLRTSRISSTASPRMRCEIFDDLPDIDVILVPIGGGSGACGCALVRSWLGSRATVIGVQAEGADAFARSWRTGTRVERGRSRRSPKAWRPASPSICRSSILRRELDDVVTLSEGELADGVRLALETTHNLAEGAGAASLAAAVKLKDRFAASRWSA